MPFVCSTYRRSLHGLLGKFACAPSASSIERHNAWSSDEDAVTEAGTKSVEDALVCRELAKVRVSVLRIR